MPGVSNRQQISSSEGLIGSVLHATAAR